MSGNHNPDAGKMVEAELNGCKPFGGAIVGHDLAPGNDFQVVVKTSELSRAPTMELRWENGTLMQKWEIRRYHMRYENGLYAGSHKDTTGEWLPVPSVRDHRCEYESDGGGCKTCGKTAAESLLPNDQGQLQPDGKATHVE
jgi:hypothetical protein